MWKSLTHKHVGGVSKRNNNATLKEEVGHLGQASVHWGNWDCVNATNCLNAAVECASFFWISNF